MKRLALCLILTACTSGPHRPALQWTENGFMPYDRTPTRREQAAYNEAARKSMGISRAEWQTGQRPHDQWEFDLWRMSGYPADARHDTGLEAALNTP